MDSIWMTAFIVIGITILLILLLRFLHNRDKQKQKNWRELQLNELLNNHQITLSEKEQLPHAFIGMDTSQAILIYVGYYDNALTSEIIHLKDIRSAKVDVAEQQVFEERGGKKVVADRHTTSVQLVLTPHNDGREKHRLLFYQLIYDSLEQKNVMIQRANHWQQMVNQYINQITSNPRQTHGQRS